MPDYRLESAGLTPADIERVHAEVEPWDDARERLAAFEDLCVQGPHPARTLLRNLDWLGWIAAQAEHARGLDVMTEELADRVEGADADILYRELRRFKQRESLRIFLREVRQRASMRETTAEIADLAQACIDTSVRELGRIRALEDVAGEFCVLGMGKLGGRELNFSSDVDLVYACSDRAMTDDAFRRRAIELGQALTDAIAATTEDGYVFRVDLRLRPDGTQGPLVQPRRAMADYYLQFGRTWERSAWLKARPIGGDLALGRALLEDLEPFVYRKYLDFGALQELGAMKEMIEANAEAAAVAGDDRIDEPAPPAPASPLGERLRARMSGFGPPRHRPRSASAGDKAAAPDRDRTGVLGWDVKIGIGGIREIEFFVQALQLVHCGTRPRLRTRNTLDALDVLLWAGLVSHDDHAVLADAYDFHRRVEHRVQMEHDRQSHRLPVRWKEFDALAERMGLGRDELRDRVIRHRTAVRWIFERLFESTPRTETDPTLQSAAPSGIDLLLRASPSQLAQQPALSTLARLGFQRPRQVAGQLQVLREKSWGPFREDAWGSDAELGRRILVEARSAPDPDLAFSHMARFAQAVADRPGYWSMLRDNPHALRLLLQVFGSSSYLSSALIRDPNLFERLLAVGTVALEKTAERMRAEFAERLDGIEDPEHRLGIVRRFHREETLRAGLHETGGAARIEQTLEQLSLLAEVVIEAVLVEVWEPLRSRRRRPGSLLPPLDEMPFAVVAMGKLGGRELGFGSDLDIVFVYEDERQYRLGHSFFARLGQRLVRTLSSLSEEGKMYEVDTRLRPSGSQGALVVSLPAFREYYEASAGVWERQALIRARPIAGPPMLRRALMDARDDLAFEWLLPGNARAEIATMRERIRESMYPPGSRDVKFGPGGLVDIEFATQALQLHHGREASDRDESETVREGRRVDPGIRSQSTWRAILCLRDRLDDPRLTQLAEDYLFLARVQARLRMTGESGSSVVADDAQALEMLARRTGHQGERAAQSFRTALDSTMQRAFDLCDEVLAP